MSSHSARKLFDSSNSFRRCVYNDVYRSGLHKKTWHTGRGHFNDNYFRLWSNKSHSSGKNAQSFDRAYTWTARIDRFTENTDDEESKYEITDENRQVQHGRIAIARGGIFGVFPGNSIERDYLPQAYSDFIYAIIVEEMGLVGGIFVILLYLILLFRAGRIATESPTVFPAVLVIGLSLMIVIQSFVSMSVATSLGPVTGQPLPLISRGGTSILITCIYFGIIFGITRQLKEGGQPVDETMDEKEEDKIPVVTLDEL